MGQFGGQPYFEGPIESKSRILMPEYGDKDLKLTMIKEKFQDDLNQKRLAAAQAKADAKTKTDELKMIPSEAKYFDDRKLNMKLERVKLTNEYNSLYAANGGKISETEANEYATKEQALLKQERDWTNEVALAEAKLGTYTKFKSDVSNNHQTGQFIADSDGNFMTIGQMGWVPEGHEDYDKPTTYEQAFQYYETLGRGLVPDMFFNGGVDTKLYETERDAYSAQLKGALEDFTSFHQAEMQEMIGQNMNQQDIFNSMKEKLSGSEVSGVSQVYTQFATNVTDENNSELTRALNYKMNLDKLSLQSTIDSPDASSDKKAEAKKRLESINANGILQYAQEELFQKSGGDNIILKAISEQTEKYKETPLYGKQLFETEYKQPGGGSFTDVETDVPGSVEQSIVSNPEYSHISRSMLGGQDVTSYDAETNKKINDLRLKMEKEIAPYYKDGKPIGEDELKTASQIRGKYLKEAAQEAALYTQKGADPVSVASIGHYLENKTDDPVMGLQYLIDTKNTYKKRPMDAAQLNQYFPQYEVGKPLKQGTISTQGVFMFGKQTSLPIEFQNGTIVGAESYIVGVNNDGKQNKSIAEVTIRVPLANAQQYFKKNTINVPSEKRIKNGSVIMVDKSFEDFDDLNGGMTNEILGVNGYDFEDNQASDTPITIDKNDYVDIKIGLIIDDKVQSHAKSLLGNQGPRGTKIENVDQYSLNK